MVKNLYLVERKQELKNDIKEQTDRCSCVGIIDQLYCIQSSPVIKQGRCFRCGTPFVVIVK